MEKKVTISEVAKYVGVSKSTISQYMNGNYNKMSKKTRINIKNAINKLNYSPSKQAQFLTTRKSNLIGVVVADISNMYSSLLLKGISTYFEETDYQIVIVEASNSHNKETNVLKKLLDQNVDGIIIQPIHSDINQYKGIVNREIPMVLVDREIEHSNWEVITTDNEKVVSKMMNKIIEKNYDNILIITQPISNVTTRKLRYKTINEIAKNNEMSVTLLETDENNKVDFSLFEDYVFSKKSVIFALNGTILIETLKLLKKNNINIPEDIAITGFDDLDIMDIVEPGITSIKQPTKLIGKTVANLLHQKLQGKQDEEIMLETVIESTIDWRNSL
jgi:LacI family kdg operon repressor